MLDQGGRASGQADREDAAANHDFCEHPKIVLGDLARRPTPRAHVITIASPEPQSGKSMLAFHCAVALANAGASVLAVDLDGSRHDLWRALQSREATARALGVALRQPARLALHRPSLAIMLQEIARLGHNCRFVVIDTPSRELPCVRRAIAMANTLVCPIDARARDHARLAKKSGDGFIPARFARELRGLREEARARGMAMADPLLIATRAKPARNGQAPRRTPRLNRLAKALDMRLATPMAQSACHTDLFVHGLALDDLPRIPGLGDHSLGQDKAIARLLAELRLPLDHVGPARAQLPRRKVPSTLKPLSSNLREEVLSLTAAL